eukprot:6132033-Pyramimonas_sp.AAC.1
MRRLPPSGLASLTRILTMRSPGHQPRSSHRENNKLTTAKPSSDTCHSALGAIPVCPTAARSGKEREAARS